MSPRPRPPSATEAHRRWLQLVDTEGPFLSIPALRRVWPQGMPALPEAARLGWERVLLVGDAPYYRRFGFRKIEGVEMPPPTNPDRVLALSLHPGAWDSIRGTVEKDIDPSGAQAD